ncbi:MAG TPA: hypothetical protein VGD79_01040 [Thermoanaerobaculia bacterium]|jgi:hypothetical protein
MPRPLFRESRPPYIPRVRRERAETESVDAQLQAAGAYRPGDFVLVKSKTLQAKLIRLGQWLRFRGDDRRYIGWSHAAVIVDADGGLVEAVGSGVQKSHVDHYKDVDHAVVDISALVDAPDREEVVAFANWCLDERYGYLTIISITIAIITGSKLIFGIDGQNICSGLVARALERTRAIFQRASSHITPADLAKMFDVPSAR